MLTYTLDKQAGLSLYEQLYRRVKADILSGRLTAGEKLPSKRALAAHLEVSVITVKNAYEQLMVSSVRPVPALWKRLAIKFRFMGDSSLADQK